MTHTDRLRTRELREDAAMWFALMRGPEAEAQRARFETWLAAEPAHRQAYNHIAEVFSLGKGLKPLVEAPGALLPAKARQPAILARAIGSPVIVLLLFLAFVPVLVGLTIATMRAIGPGHPFVQATGSGTSLGGETSLATARGEVRTFRLGDGSRVTLDSDSRVRVALSAQRRDLALLRGRARFFVAHEPRPFVVAAGGGSVLARGTVFDVALRGEAGASVDLIEGLVDVRQPRADGAPAGSPRDESEVTRLTAGHGLAIGAPRGLPLRAVPSAPIDWTSDLRAFQEVPLRDLLAEANRYTDKPLVLADPALGDLRVSGTFRVREPVRLAGNLAELLDLALVESPSGIALARRCTRGEKNFCPPS
ncbi:FecR domain-containing protein [Novosphingobium sp. P6W]|uniref:FecR family protein n=1 Tax=Novosphingobium sp. P6W TaxID=1609758 RepID=UPI0005C2EAD1|nr:FecR domain-containing protein [Novosphingobium sp. P6W]AXB75886.1 DUF4880 domain-containing protein [Novosphingobium sp. P6W]KIS32914.1 anti-sigma factor [Novosphingobium sp. P6W]